MSSSTLKAAWPLLLALTSLGLLPGCDVVTNPQPVQTATPPAPASIPTANGRSRGDTLVLDSLERTWPASALAQGVLLEDFTGQYFVVLLNSWTVWAGYLSQRHESQTHPPSLYGRVQSRFAQLSLIQ